NENLFTGYCNDIVIEEKPLKATPNVDDRCYHHYFSGNHGNSSEEVSMMVHQCFDNAILSFKEEGIKRASRRKRSVPLQLEDIQKYFSLPIIKAAKEMRVGLTCLKRRCRELGIMRWPHRKIKSLNFLISNVKEQGLTKEMMMLEEHKRLLHNFPDTELTERTKRLRQACFKANYKQRRLLAAHKMDKQRVNEEGTGTS
ncbi:hypothetical protein Tsubulata_009784, partial [Turnera subulata]